MSQSKSPETSPAPAPPNADGTREEWTAFTELCVHEFLSVVIDRALYGYGLSSDAARAARYERQLAEAADHIGQAEVEAAYDRVAARWRNELGERLWTAVVNDEPALAEEVFRADASAGGE